MIDKGLYQIACLLEEISRKLEKSQGCCFNPIKNISSYAIGNAETFIYRPNSDKGLIEIINASYNNPDILRIKIVGVSGQYIPLNTGESRKIYLISGQEVRVKFDNISSGEVVVVEYNL